MLTRALIFLISR